MAKFRKAILHANRTYHSPDGPLRVTPERLRHWAKKHAELTAAGVKVPVSWGHGDSIEQLVPVKFSSDKKSKPPQGTVGYLDSFAVAKDGSSAEIVLDIRRAADVEMVSQNLAYVSPVIFESWTDGDGITHRDVITHADLVQHPVDHHQSEFSPVSVACALRMSTNSGTPIIYRLEDEPMEDDDAPDFASADDDDSGPDDEIVDDDAGRIKKVIAGLAGLNIVLSEDTNAENFLRHLEQALLTAAAMNGESSDGMSGDGSDMTLATPEMAALSLETKRWREHANKEHRGKVEQRLKALVDSGRCTPAEAKERQAAIPTVRLSLDDSGNHRPSSIESWIESREAVPAGTFWPSERKLRLSVAEHPEHVEGELVAPEHVDALVTSIFRRA